MKSYIRESLHNNIMAEMQARQKQPQEEWTKQGVLYAASVKVTENTGEALSIAWLALKPCPDYKNTLAADFLHRVEGGKVKDLRVSFGVYNVAKEQVLYSVKLEANGASEILTVRVGQDFTEISLEKNGRIVEILREQGKEFTRWSK